jgi:hypothetical protein
LSELLIHGTNTRLLWLYSSLGHHTSEVTLRVREERRRVSEGEWERVLERERDRKDRGGGRRKDKESESGRVREND